MSIESDIADLHSAAENDDAFIIAAAINLYNENLRRREGRILYHHGDVQRLFHMCQLLLERTAPPKLAPRERTFATDDEIEKVNDVYQEIEDMTQTKIERRV